MMIAFSENYSLSGWMKPLLNTILSSVNEIRVDLPSSGSIYFQVGFINKKLDIKQFETPRSCQDNELWRTISETGDLAYINMTLAPKMHKEAADS
ncbi:hypothetical protein KY285_000811 [Solanum tuberosum]|nr:hypothetical protein KY285_000811 [Solanum tuberosum]